MGRFSGLLQDPSSDQPAEVVGSDGERYFLYRDGKKLVQERDRDLQVRSILSETFRKNYVGPALRQIKINE